MKTKILGILISFLILLCAACERDKICLEDSPCPTNEYMPLAVGNYWVYENVLYNFNNYSITVFPGSDTVKVVGDTIIKGNKYYSIQGAIWSSTFSPFSNSDTSYFRDSSGYLVDLYGNIHFSSIDRDRTLQEYFFANEEKFISYSVPDSIVTAATPAGPFNCLNFTGCLFNGLVWEDLKYNNYYSKGVGLVYQTSHPPLPQITRENRRLLVDYHLE